VSKVTVADLPKADELSPPKMAKVTGGGDDNPSGQEIVDGRLLNYIMNVYDYTHSPLGTTLTGIY
jgi:hypothetical protein